MKSTAKTKTTPKRRVSKKAKPSTRVVKSVRTKLVGLRRFRLVEHKNTGKLIHRKHTSHLILFIILLILGFFLYISGNFTFADSGTVSVGLTVSSHAPTVGATITSPTDGTELTDQSTLDVSGTCADDTFVVVSDNGATVGSAMCSDAGVFSLTIQINMGTNVLTAMNYDNLNQAGPATSSVTVNVKHVDNTPPVIPTPPILPPVVPVNPSVIPGVKHTIDTCDGYKQVIGTLPTGGVPHVAIVCVPRLFEPGVKQTLLVLVWGGDTPYALNIDLGNGQKILLSVTKPGYQSVSFSYGISGIYKISLDVSDKEGKSAVVQTAVQVNGDTNQSGTTNTNKSNDDLLSALLKTPVPLYVMAVAITLGFWGGDIFDRRFGFHKHRRKSRRAS